MIRVVIADDQALIRGGLRAILIAEPDIEVVGEAGDGAAAARVAGTEAADVVLMDIQMPGTDGIEGVRRVAAARPQAKVLILTMFDLDEYVFAALQAGASGFLLKTTPPEMLAAAIRACHGGEHMFAPTVTRRLIDSYVHRPPVPAGIPPVLRVLTQREMDVFQAMALGLTNSEIASKLYMGEATVKTHVTRVLAKLGLRDRVHAILLAYESGLMGR
ncbi:DNA-binding NarL/FixJ family response regulator [Pseudarthrobacter siccitolerans]|uniref:DNA-binding NarL/FixJ family response regulator n=1 Tax=Pseudarthrobacter siccitolerans TaxID=861266 RepID=A0ABU0PFP0_9MICC|nr:response regulator transcription factor [Pseudarthrobacter siccitolerans]MDQ0672775.1 DNA-binding NarL/FixJ family response regulator [Pseudarthrobacter siccitolerans]